MIAIPKGQLLTSQDGVLTAQLRANRPARKAMRAWFESLAAARPRGILAHEGLDDGPRGFEIRYAADAQGTLPLAAALAEWRRDLPSSLPNVLDLARFVLGLASDLAERDCADALVAPGSIRLVPGAIDPWRLVPLPTQGASLADWARADPDAWLWTAAETVLGTAGNDPSHALGAAIHHAPDRRGLSRGPMPHREQFGRLIRGRSGAAGQRGSWRRRTHRPAPRR